MPLRLVLTGLILLTALGLGIIAFQAVQPSQGGVHVAAPPPPVMRDVLTVAHALPAGTLIREEDIKARAISVAQVPDDVLADTPDQREGLRGGLLRRYVDAGAPLRADDVLRPRDRGFLAAVLAPGTRAIGVGVDAITGVGGLIWPGDRVDVILTQEMPEQAASLARRIVGETILTDVRVVAVDQSIAEGASGSDAAPGKLARTVTLEVSAEQAERAAVAMRLGHLALTIRAAAPGVPVPVAANDAGPERGSTFGADVSPALAGSEPQVAARMRVIQGDKIDEVRFQ